MDLLNVESLKAIEAFIRANAVWGAPLLFGVMVLEGLVFTTFIFSGTLFIVMAGVLIQAGVLGYLPVFAATCAGYWLGDWANCEFGRIAGPRMRELAVVKARTGLLAKAEGMLDRHGIAAIFISRFMGPLRPFVTLLAGTSGMPRITFHAVTLIATALLVAGLLNAGMTGVQFARPLQVALRRPGFPSAAGCPMPRSP